MSLKKFIIFVLIGFAACAMFYYGVSVGDPQDMRIEASGL